jgi:two-component system capsular synthesis response regulator RcsB
VLRLFAAGMSMTEVANKVNRTVQTASAHKVSAMRKLGVKNDSELHAALRDLRLL